MGGSITWQRDFRDLTRAAHALLFALLATALLAPALSFATPALERALSHGGTLDAATTADIPTEFFTAASGPAEVSTAEWQSIVQTITEAEGVAPSAAPNQPVHATAAAAAAFLIPEDQTIVPPSDGTVENFGFSVDLDGNVLLVGAPNADVVFGSLLTDAGKAYVFDRTVPGDPWILQATLTSDDPADNGNFGYAVAIDDGFLAVGEPGLGNSNAGKVHPFQGFSVDSWERKNTEQNDGAPENDGGLGTAVAVVGNVIYGGEPFADADPFEPGSGLVWRWVEGPSDVWQGSPVTGITPVGGAEVGYALDAEVNELGEPRVIIGAPGEDRVYIVEDTVPPPLLAAVAHTVDGPGGFGVAVALDDDDSRAAIASSDGSLSIIERSDAATWGITAGPTPNGDPVGPDTRAWIDIDGDYLVAGIGGSGGDVGIYTTTDLTLVDTFRNSAHAPGDNFGVAMAIDGLTVVAGAPGVDEPSPDIGATLTAELPAFVDPLLLEAKVDVDGDWAVLSRNGADVSVLQKDGGFWSIVRTLAIPASASQDIALSVAISENFLAVGDPLVGNVLLYKRDAGNDYTLAQTITDVVGAPYGYAVDISINQLIVGNPRPNFLTSNAAGAFVYELTAAGANDNPGEYELLECLEDTNFVNNGCGSAVAISAIDGVSWVGAPYSDAYGANAGALFRFQELVPGREPATDNPIGNATLAPGAALGTSVAAESSRGAGMNAIAGAPGDANGAGTVWVMGVNGADETNLVLLDTGAAAGDRLGANVDASGDLIMAAAGNTAEGYRLYANADDGGFVAVETDPLSATSVYADIAIDSMDVVVGYDGTLFQASTLDPLPNQPANKLLADNGSTLDRFGYSVDIVGDTMALLARTADGQTDVAAPGGSGYIFKRDAGGGWSQDQVLRSTVDADGLEGALSENHVAIRSTGIVDVFERPDPTDAFDPTRVATFVVDAVTIDVADGTLVVGDTQGGCDTCGVVELYDIASESLIERISHDSALFATIGFDVAFTGDELIFTSLKLGTLDTMAWIIEAGAGAQQFDPATGTEVGPFSAGIDGFITVDIDGDRAVVGVPFDNGGNGAAFVYTKNAMGDWDGEQLAQPSGDLGGENELGSAVDIEGDIILVAARQGESNTQGHLHTYGFNGAAWVETESPILATDGETSDLLGFDAALSGTTIVAGAPFEDQNGTSAGAAYVFTATGAPAIEPDNKLLIDGGVDGDLAGSAIAVDGNVMVIGAPQFSTSPLGNFGSGEDGAVFVYRRDTATSPWVFDQRIDNPGPAANAEFGADIAYVGDALVVGAPGQASAYVFEQFAGGFSLFDTLVSGQPTDRFGDHVDIDDSGTIIIGAYAFDNAAGQSTGAAHLYYYSGVEVVFIESIEGSNAGDGFGRDVAISNGLAAVGAFQADGDGLGFIETYSANEFGFVPIATINSTTGSSDLFGSALDLDDTTLAVGIPNGVVGGNAIGRAQVYEFDSATQTWNGPIELPVGTGGDLDDNIGSDIAVDQGLIVVGAKDSDFVDIDAGGLFVFSRTTAGGWEETKFFTADDAAAVDELGWGVAVQGDEIFAGAPLDDNGNGLSEPGAVYFFSVDQPELVVDEPTVSITLTPSVASVDAGATAVSVVDLPPTALEGFGGADSNIAGTALGVVAASSTVDTPVPLLAETSVGDLGIDGDLLADILLSDVPIEGGWEVILAGSPLDGRPLQTVSLGEVVDTGLLDDTSLELLDLASTPISAIPISAIPISAIPISAIPISAIPISAIGGVFTDWCAYITSLVPDRTCTDDPANDTADLNISNDSILELAIKGVPISAIPISAIPISAIPISPSISAIPISAIEVEGTPISAIPISAIDIAQLPISAIPISAIPISAIPISAIPISAIPISAIDVEGAPISAIEIDGTPISAITLGDLNAGGGIAASPISAIPISAIPISAIPISAIPISAIPISAIPISAISVDSLESTPISAIEIDGTPISAIPISAIDIAGSPISAIPISAIPISAIPISAIPISAIPISAIPISAIPISAIDPAALPISAIPISAIPISAIDLEASPISAIPISAIPISAIDGVIDCALIDCDGGFTIGDARAAGALNADATLDFLDDADIDLRLSDLLGVNGMTIADLYGQLAAIPDFAELGDFEDFADMVLGDLDGTAELDATLLSELGDGLSYISLVDLINSIDGLSEADVQTALATAGLITLRDLLLNTPHGESIVIGDLPADDANFQAQTLAHLIESLEGTRLSDVVDLLDADLADIDWADFTLGDIDDWEDVTLGELIEILVGLANDGDPSNDVLIGQLISALSGDAADNLTYGDLLLSLLSSFTYDWQEIDLAALDLESAGDVSFVAAVRVDSPLGTLRSVSVDATMPIDGVYVPGSAELLAIGRGLPAIAVEPQQAGSALNWQLDDIEPNLDYELSFDVSPSLILGSRPFSASADVVGRDAFSASATTVTVTEAYEPNDALGDAGIVDVATDTIYVSHIGEEADIDLYSITLDAGARLAVSLSSLPADYDLVVYGPPSEPLVPLSLKQIDPTESPVLGLDPSETSSGNVSADEIVLQELPIAGLSTNRDLADDYVDIGAVRRSGTYYIQVSGYNGANSADPYALFVKAQDPDVALNCAAQDYQVGSTATLPSDADLAGVNTLILVNGERMTAKYGVADTGDVFTALDALTTYTNTTNPGFGINAAVIALDGSADIRAAYAALDTEACQPERSNDVVREIAELVGELRTADPNTDIGHIMIVGDDDVVPMARIADYTTIANEKGYASTFLDTDANSLFGAASLRYFLSDEPYGDIDPIIFGSNGTDRALYVTDTALGRVVETPEEIVGQLGLFIASAGELDPSSAIVSGYDFLSDGAQAVADTLDALPDTTVATPLINEDWTATDLIGEIYPAPGDAANLAAVNAHFDHYRALPADGNASGAEDDLFTTLDITDPSVTDEIEGSLFFSMGCHGGLNVPDELFPGDPRALDWAQAYAQEQAIWVGNTGYGYGETRTPEGVELSERLMLHFAQRLDGSLTAGEALFFAKQWYLGTQKSAYGEYDEKVLQQTTFYGIPFFKLGVASPPPPEPIPPQPQVYPLPNLDLDVSTIVSDPFFTEQVSPLGEGSSWTATVPAGDPGRTSSQATPFTQIQPTISYDVSNVDQVTGDPVKIAQGALITSMATRDVNDVDPDLARPVVDDSTVETEPIVGDVFSDLTVYVSQYLEPEGARQQLTATLGSFSSDPDQFSITGIGTQRLFEDIVFEVLYRDLSSDADQAKPTFLQVDSAVIDNGGADLLVVDAIVADDLPDNVERVTALVGEDLGTGTTAWSPMELTKTSGDAWSGSIPISGSEIEFVLQAVDANGNVALSANKGQYFVETASAPTPPPPAELDLDIDRAPDNGAFYTGPVIVTAAAGGDDVDYQVNDGEIVDAGTEAVVTLDPAVLGDGVHTVTISSPGIADDYVVTVVFDTTPPTVNILSPTDGATLDQGAGVPAVFTCSDAASGVASCAATLNGTPLAVDGDVTLNPGTYSLSVVGTDSLTNTTTESITFTVAEVAQPSCGALAQQAEDGTIAGNFVTRNNANVVGGAYVTVPQRLGNNYQIDTSDYVEFCITIDTPGNHRIDARTFAPTFRRDSFFAQIDGGDIAVWDVRRSFSWRTDPISDRGVADPWIVDLGPGDHTLRIFQRESGTHLDEFELIWLDPGSFGGPPACSGLSQEAEAGTMRGSMSIITNPTASGQQAVSSANGSGRFYTPKLENYAEYCVTVPTTGDFRIDATTIAPNFLSDSFFVQIDDDPDLIVWDVQQSIGWVDDAVSDRGVADPVIVNLSAGDHTIRFIQREDVTALDKFELVPVVAPPACAGLSVEAEDATLAGSMQVLQREDAIGGSYVGVPQGVGNNYTIDLANYVEFCVTVTQADTYWIVARTTAPNSGSDSFFVQINDEPITIWDLRRSSGFRTQRVRARADGNTLYALDAGVHTVRLYQREDSTGIDNISLSR